MTCFSSFLLVIGGNGDFLTALAGYDREFSEVQRLVHCRDHAHGAEAPDRMSAGEIDLLDPGTRLSAGNPSMSRIAVDQRSDVDSSSAYSA